MRYYYLLASLPPVFPIFGSEPPISVENFWNKIQEEAIESQEAVSAIILWKDLLNLNQLYVEKEPFSQGKVDLETLKRTINDSQQREICFPEEISKYIGNKWNEEIWEHYFSYALKILAKNNSNLENYFNWELGLRNLFYRNRIEGNKYYYDIVSEHEKIFSSYNKASNPLEAEKLLDKIRWDKISEFLMPYSFKLDEVLAYTLKLIILDRWWMISKFELNLEKVTNE